MISRRLHRVVVRDGERRHEAEHVGVPPARRHEDALVEQLEGDLADLLAGQRLLGLAVRDDLDADHEAVAAHVADDRHVGHGVGEEALDLLAQGGGAADQVGLRDR